MDQMRTTQAAKYLGVHRSTLNRLSASVLPPDGYSSSNRPYWLKSTLDRHRLGMLRAGALVYVDYPSLPELSVQLAPRQTVLGYSTIPIPIDVPAMSPGLALSVVLAYLADHSPMAMLLPAEFNTQPLHQTTVQICRSVGTTVVLVP